MSKHNIDKEIKNIEKLKALSVCDKRSKKKILSKADRDLICVLKDFILNVLLGNIKLSQAEKNQLQTHKYILRKIIATKQVNKNRELLVQKGGSFLPLCEQHTKLLTRPCPTSILLACRSISHLTYLSALTSVTPSDSAPLSASG